MSRKTLESFFELRIDFHLISGRPSDWFRSPCRRWPSIPRTWRRSSPSLRGNRMRRDAIVALVGETHRHVDHLFGERIEGARSHNLLDIFPGASEGGGIMGNRLPEIIDAVGLACCYDVVINGANFRVLLTLIFMKIINRKIKLLIIMEYTPFLKCVTCAQLASLNIYFRKNGNNRYQFYFISFRRTYFPTKNDDLII